MVGPEFGPERRPVDTQDPDRGWTLTVVSGEPISSRYGRPGTKGVGAFGSTPTGQQAFDESS